MPTGRRTTPPDRVGVTEMQDIDGLYTFWDELRRAHPGLQIDNCASGGRRLDVETMSRSVLPLAQRSLLFTLRSHRESKHDAGTQRLGAA